MLKNIKIGIKLIAVGSLMLLLPILAMGIISTNTASDGLEALIREELEKRTEEISRSVSNTLILEAKMALDIAGRKEARTALERDSATGGSGAPYEMSAILEDFVATEGLGDHYMGINIINPRGKVISASSQDRIGLDLAERSYFLDAMKGELNIGIPAISMATGLPFIPIAAPIHSDDGEIIGAAALILKLDFLWPIIQDSTIGETGYTFITDSNGLIISHPDDTLIFEVNLESLAGMEMITERFKNRENGYEKYIYKGEPKRAGFAIVPDTNWGVFLTIPDSEFLAAAYSVRNTIIIVGAIGFIVAMIIFILFARALTNPIKKGVQFAQEISEGKLYTDIDVNQKDEIGLLAEALKAMKEKLRSVVSDVFNASTQVTDGSSQLAQSAEQLSQGASEQAANAEEVSASVEEMGANIHQNTENAAETAKLSSRSAVDAEEGGSAVLETVKAMNEIAAKINVVGDIARQTNLLSLNAAIEAARAGEQGKGFAVVASEVGKLAAVSQKASAEILELVTQSVKQANNAGDKIKAIVPDIRQTAELVSEISASSQEQNTGAGQINEAMQQLDQVIQQNAASAEEASAMSEELTSQAEQLREMISFFRMETPAHRPEFDDRERPIKAIPMKAASPSRALPPAPPAPDHKAPRQKLQEKTQSYEEGFQEF